MDYAQAARPRTAPWWSTLFDFLERTQAPFERTFFDWRGGVASTERAARSPSATLYAGEAFAPVRGAMAALEPKAGALTHCYFTGPAPCTMLIDEVEALWASIAGEDDWAPIRVKLAAIDEMRLAYDAPQVDAQSS